MKLSLMDMGYDMRAWWRIMDMDRGELADSFSYKNSR
jgi:hypothetical protein